MTKNTFYRKSKETINISIATKYSKPSEAFTIVELLVVIVVIGILAAITIVSYTGVSQKATAAALQSDLANAKKQIMMYQVIYSSYPTTLDANKCPSAPTADTKYCLKTSSNNSYTNYASNGTSFFTLAATNSNDTTYTVTDSLAPKVATLDPTDWLTIGTQTWAKANLNVGTMITGVTAQTNNSTIEKYCYNNTESNCTTYGAFYQWDEAMQYVVTQGAQGICPAGSHIPSDNDWKILEVQLGMSQAQADASGWRGTDQGTQLKSGGASGLNMPLAGRRYTDGSFGNLSSYAGLWSSSESGVYAWYRYLDSGLATVYRGVTGKGVGYSVRCMGN